MSVNVLIERCRDLNDFTGIQCRINFLEECGVDPAKFWKSIGNIGVNCSNSNVIPMEVILEDCSIFTEVDVVLARWKIL